MGGNGGDTGGDGSGGDGGTVQCRACADGTNPTQTAQVVNRLTPCLTQALTSLMGILPVYANQVNANGSTSMFLPISYFAGSNTNNWTLRTGVLAQNTLGSTISNFSNHNVFTTFDPQQLQNATDLFVMRLMMHESVHAYLVAYFENDPTKAGVDYPGLIEAFARQSSSQQNNTQHNLTVTDFKNDIGQVLYTYSTQLGYNVSLQYCQDLAWGGLQNTAAWQALSQSEKNRIFTALNQELSGVNAKGLKPSGC